MELKKIIAVCLVMYANVAATALADLTPGPATIGGLRIYNDRTAAATAPIEKIMAGHTDAAARISARPTARYCGYTSKEQKFNQFLFEGNKGKTLIVIQQQRNAAQNPHSSSVRSQRANYFYEHHDINIPPPTLQYEHYNVTTTT